MPPLKTKQLPGLIASLQLENYLVDDLVFKSNSFVVGKKDHTIAPTITIDFNVKPHNKDISRFLIVMEVDLNKDQELKQFNQYQMHLHLLGWFKFNENIDAQTKTRMMFTNGSSILY